MKAFQTLIDVLLEILNQRIVAEDSETRVQIENIFTFIFITEKESEEGSS